MTPDSKRKWWRVRLEVEHVIQVPDDWTADEVDFYMNEGSTCSETHFRSLVDSFPEPEKMYCTIENRFDSTVLGPVTDADLENKDGWIPQAIERLSRSR